MRTFNGGVETAQEIDREIAAVVKARQSFNELRTRHPLHALMFTVQIGVEQQKGARQNVHSILSPDVFVRQDDKSSIRSHQFSC